MDAVNFIKERARMCKSNVSCFGCPAYSGNCLMDMRNWTPAEKQVRIIEHWVAQHPIKTIQSELIKMFPNIDTDINGIISICPAKFDPSIRSERCATRCGNCRKEYYLKEIKCNEQT